MIPVSLRGLALKRQISRIINTKQKQTWPLVFRQLKNGFDGRMHLPSNPFFYAYAILLFVFLLITFIPFFPRQHVLHVHLDFSHLQTG